MLDAGKRFQLYTVAACVPRRRRHHPNLERLISAAISNARLAELLLREPAQALVQFDVGQQLTAREQRMVLHIEGALDIHEFAGRLHLLVVDSQRHEWAASVHEPDPERAWRAQPADGHAFGTTVISMQAAMYAS